MAECYLIILLRQLPLHFVWGRGLNVFGWVAGWLGALWAMSMTWHIYDTGN